MSTKIYYIGHSGFFVKFQDKKGFLIDPFVSGNQKAVFEISLNEIAQIFVTHGHGDHLGDSIPISKSSGSCIYTVFELANYCVQQGANAFGVNIGGKVNFDWGWAKFLPAFHSSSTMDGKYAGMPASVLFDINGLRIYHAGDNCLNSEYSLIKDVFHPSVAMLPVGSCYTMDVDDAIIAAKLLGVNYVIPMHYNTFDAIKVDIDDMVTKFESENIKCIVLAPGGSAEF